MAVNLKQGSPIMADYTPSGAVTAGDVVIVSGTPRVAIRDIAASDLGALALFGGIYEATGDAVIANGKKIYWNATAGKMTETAAGNKLFGESVSACSADAATFLVFHNPNAELNANSIRVRSTIAEVNAGKTLLPAIAGYKYVIRDVKAISVGGAAAAVTTVDILATQSASSVKLVAFAQASLTQSTLLRAGASGAAILADGASFVANDANTAVTIGKTGSSVTTATHIDVIIDYALEAA